MREFEVDLDVLHAASTRLATVREDVLAVTVGPSRADRYGHDGLRAAASLFADRWQYAVETAAGDVESTSVDLQATAQTYGHSDTSAAGRMEPV